MSKLEPYTLLRRMLAVALLFVVLMLIHLAPNAIVFDDAFIHLRIARNVIQHGVPYYNLNDPAMTSSSPLWTLVLSALYGITGVNIFAVAILNAFITTCCAVAWFSLISLYDPSTSNRFRAPLGTSLLVCALLPASIGLMETPLAMLLLGLGLYFFEQRRLSSLSVLVFAAATRPELSLVVALSVIVALKDKFWSFKKVVLSILGPGIPFAIYCIYFFGTLIPQGAAAKQVAHQLPFVQFAEIALDRLAVVQSVSYGALRSGLVLPYIVALVFVLLWVLKANSGNRENLTARLLVVSSIGILILYAAKRTFLFHWYIPLLSIPFSLAPFLVRAAFPRLLWLALFVIWYPIWGEGIERSAAGYQEKGIFAKRVDFYLDIGQRLNKHHRSARVMASEIGALGFAFEGEIFDGVGLASPAAVSHHPLKVPEERLDHVLGAIPPSYIREIQPDIIVSFSNLIGGADKRWLVHEYRIERFWPCAEEEDPDQRWMCEWFGELLVLYHNTYQTQRSLTDRGV